jgi:hypothetical protein
MSVAMVESSNTDSTEKPNSNIFSCRATGKEIALENVRHIFDRELMVPRGVDRLQRFILVEFSFDGTR